MAIPHESTRHELEAAIQYHGARSRWRFFFLGTAVVVLLLFIRNAMTDKVLVFGAMAEAL
jgi:hypothetical protein